MEPTTGVDSPPCGQDIKSARFLMSLASLGGRGQKQQASEVASIMLFTSYWSSRAVRPAPLKEGGGNSLTWAADRCPRESSPDFCHVRLISSRHASQKNSNFMSQVWKLGKRECGVIFKPLLRFVQKPQPCERWYKPKSDSAVLRFTSTFLHLTQIKLFQKATKFYNLSKEKSFQGYG